jgi:predicted membrane protein DUF2306
LRSDCRQTFRNWVFSGLPVIRPEIEHNGTKYPQKWIIAVMRSYLPSAALTLMWFLALVAALNSARYFLTPPRLLLPNEILALSRHHTWILVHIASGIVAITVGLFQFVGRLRDTHPQLHRSMGYVCLSAVFRGAV